MDVLQAALLRLQQRPYEPSNADDMTGWFVPVIGNFYGPHEGLIQVDWRNANGGRLQGDDRELEFYDASAFYDAIERFGFLHVESMNRYGGTVSVRGSDANHLHDVIETIRDLVDFFAQEAARPVR